MPPAFTQVAVSLGCWCGLVDCSKDCLCLLHIANLSFCISKGKCLFLTPMVVEGINNPLCVILTCLYLCTSILCKDITEVRETADYCLSVLIDTIGNAVC